MCDSKVTKSLLNLLSNKSCFFIHNKASSKFCCVSMCWAHAVKLYRTLFVTVSNSMKFVWTFWGKFIRRISNVIANFRQISIVEAAKVSFIFEVLSFFHNCTSSYEHKLSKCLIIHKVFFSGRSIRFKSCWSKLTLWNNETNLL